MDHAASLNKDVGEATATKAHLKLDVFVLKRLDIESYRRHGGYRLINLQSICNAHCGWYKTQPRGTRFV